MLRTHIEPQRCIFEVSGELSGQMAVDLVVELRRAADACPCREIVIDLSAVDEIDAAGIWTLIEAKSIADGVVRIVGHSQAVLARLGVHSLGNSLQRQMVQVERSARTPSMQAEQTP